MFGSKSLLTRRPRLGPGAALHESRGAFTLIEILIVISIISLLASFVMTGIQLAKRRAERVLRTLVDDYGIMTSRISVRVYGRSRTAPRFPNIAEDEQRERVDLIINVRP